MNSLQLKEGHWKQKKKTAEFSIDGTVILTIEFRKKNAKVVFENRQLEIKTQGFWYPQVIITEDEKILLTQKHIGFWGSKNEVQIGEKIYEGKTATNTLYNIAYSSRTGEEIVSYILSTLKWKAEVNFYVNERITSFEDLLLLFILGYYTIKGVAQENTIMATIKAGAS